MLRKRPTRDPYVLTNRFLVDERKAGGERLRIRGHGEAIAPKSENRAVCVCFLTHQSSCHNVLLIASHFGIVRLDRPPAAYSSKRPMILLRFHGFKAICCEQSCPNRNIGGPRNKVQVHEAAWNQISCPVHRPPQPCTTFGCSPAILSALPRILRVLTTSPILT